MKGEQPLRVETGALDDRRHFGRQVAAAILGWLLSAGLVVSLSLSASEIAIHVTLFLVTSCLLIAVLAVTVAVVLLRPRLIRDRGHDVPSPAGLGGLDALG